MLFLLKGKKMMTNHYILQKNNELVELNCKKNTARLFVYDTYNSNNSCCSLLYR